MKSNTNWAISFTFANDFGGAVVVGRSRDESNGSKIINAVLTISLDSNCKFIHTAQKMKFSMKDFFSKCDQIRKKLRIWSHLLKKYLMENLFLCAVTITECIHRGIRNMSSIKAKVFRQCQKWRSTASLFV